MVSNFTRKMTPSQILHYGFIQLLFGTIVNYCSGDRWKMRHAVWLWYFYERFDYAIEAFQSEDESASNFYFK